MQFTKWLRALVLLGVNLVPAFGWFFAGWSLSTTLLVYWFENIATSFFIAARILIHRKMTRCAGYFEYAPPNGKKSSLQSGSYLSGYLTSVLVFSAAQGVFLLLLIFLLFPRAYATQGGATGVDYYSLKVGCTMVVLLLAGNFVADLPGLKHRSFRWVEMLCQYSLGRVVLIQFTIIFGMMALAITGGLRGFFGVFIGLKTLADVGSAFPSETPKAPPRWLVSILNRIKPKGKEPFDQFWKRDEDEEAARQKKNERRLA